MFRNGWLRNAQFIGRLGKVEAFGNRMKNL
jgi:hypothetical protein